MRAALALLVLAACASDEPATEGETHELKDCDQHWYAYVHPFEAGETQCEAACAARPPTGLPSGTCYFDGESRFGHVGRAPGEWSCAFEVDWRGRWGCCVPDMAPVRFVECKAE